MERKAQVLVASAGALAGLGLALGLSAGAVQAGGVEYWMPIRVEDG